MYLNSLTKEYMKGSNLHHLTHYMLLEKVLCSIKGEITGDSKVLNLEGIFTLTKI